MSEWKEYILEDVVEKFIDYRGKTPSKKSFGIPLVTAKIVKEGRLLEPNEFIAESDYAGWMTRGFPEINDLIITTEAPLGEVALIKDKSVALAQRIITIQTKKKLCNSVFLKYYFQSNVGQGILQARASGSTVEGIKSAELKKVEILIPPLPEQTAIAEVISSIDNKIDLLHRQNKTLEQLAETLFRQWFVEEEWNGTLSEYIKVQGGYAFKSADFKENGFAGVIKIRNISMGMIDISKHDCVDESVVKNIDKRFKIKSGDFLIAMTGAEIGKIGIVEKTEKEIWVNQRVGKLEAKVSYGDLIGYLALKSREGQEHIINACAGSAQENISSTGIEEMNFVSYERERIDSLGKEIQPLFGKIIFNQQQIKTLTQLRDTLLPKLMSGEVRVRM